MQTAARSVALSSRRKICKISIAMIGSNIRWRGKSFAASVPPDSFNPRKDQKRLSKQERRAMAELFVDKYRASNAGKFPKASQVQQQVGGSYYIAREIVQELEYKHKTSSSNRSEEVQIRKAEKVIFPSSYMVRDPSPPQVLESLSSTTTAKERSNLDFINIVNNDKYLVKNEETAKDLEAKEESTSPNSFDKFSHEEAKSHASSVINPSKEQITEDFGDPSVTQVKIQVQVKDVPSRLEESLQGTDEGSYGRQQFVASSKSSTIGQQADVSESTKSGITVDTSSSTGVTEGSVKNARRPRTTDGLLDAHGPGMEHIENDKVPESDEVHGDHQRRLEHGESTQKESSFWGNLKSFADGIINFWKKA